MGSNHSCHLQALSVGSSRDSPLTPLSNSCGCCCWCFNETHLSAHRLASPALVQYGFGFLGPVPRQQQKKCLAYVSVWLFVNSIQLRLDSRASHFDCTASCCSCMGHCVFICSSLCSTFFTIGGSDSLAPRSHRPSMDLDAPRITSCF